MVYLLTDLRPLNGKYAIKTACEQLPDFVVLDAPESWEMREREGFLQVKTEMGWGVFGTIVHATRTWPAMCLALISRWTAIYQHLVLVIGPTSDCFTEAVRADV